MTTASDIINNFGYRYLRIGVTHVLNISECDEKQLNTILKKIKDNLGARYILKFSGDKCTFNCINIVSVNNIDELDFTGITESDSAKYSSVLEVVLSDSDAKKVKVTRPDYLQMSVQLGKHLNLKYSQNIKSQKEKPFCGL